MNDIVNHPTHYELAKFECIEVMEEVFGADAQPKRGGTLR